MYLIVIKYLLLDHLEDSDIRKFRHFNVNISAPTLTKVISSLVDLVEGKKSAETKGNRGATTFFDAWSCNDMKYMAILQLSFPAEGETFW